MASAAFASLVLVAVALGPPLSDEVPVWVDFLASSRLAATSCDGAPPWVCWSRTAWKAGPAADEPGAPVAFEGAAAVLLDGAVPEALGEAPDEPGLVVTARFAISNVLSVVR